MNITIKATNTTLTPSIKQFIYDKMATLEKFIREEDKIRLYSRLWSSRPAGDLCHCGVARATGG